MPRRVLPTAGLILVGGLMWALRIAFGTNPWPDAGAALVAADLLVVTLVSVVAFLLSPGRWVRVLVTGLAAIWGVLAVTLDVDGLWIAAVVAGGAGVAMIWTAGLDGWVRGDVRPDRVPSRATMLVLGLVLLPGLVGAAGLPAVTGGGWALAAASALLAWAYARALPAALWTVRLVLPIIGVWALVGLDPFPAIALGLAAALLVALAWSADARLAAEPLSPRRVEAVSILPEMVPRGVMESAGYDRRGRPKDTP